jgi:hypothetical protein
VGRPDEPGDDQELEFVDGALFDVIELYHSLLTKTDQVLRSCHHPIHSGGPSIRHSDQGRGMVDRPNKSGDDISRKAGNESQRPRTLVLLVAAVQHRPPKRPKKCPEINVLRAVPARVYLPLLGRLLIEAKNCRCQYISCFSLT